MLKTKKKQTKLAMTNNPTSNCQNKKEPKKVMACHDLKVTPANVIPVTCWRPFFSFRSDSPRTHFDSATRASIHW